MRSLLSRAATVFAGAALIAVSMPAGPASAATSATCPAASSTRLFTGDISGYPNNKVWVYSPSPTTTIICFYFSVTTGLDKIGGGAIVIDAPVSVSQVPSVTPGSDPALCTANLLNLVDPVPFRIAYGVSLSSFCFTAAGETVTVTLGLPAVSTEPYVELWHDGTSDTWDMALCGDDYALGWADLSDNYSECASSNGYVRLDPVDEAERAVDIADDIANDPVGEATDLVESIQRFLT